MSVVMVLVTVRVAVFRVRTGFPLFSVAVENALWPNLVDEDSGKSDAGYETSRSFEETMVMLLAVR